MIELEIKGINRFCFSKDEQIPKSIVHNGVEWKIGTIPESVQKFLKLKTNIRPVVTLGVPDWGDAYLFYVYWYKKNYANILDSLMKETKSIPASYLQNTIILRYNILECFKECNTSWHVLEIPKASPFASDPAELNWSSFKDSGEKFRPCPNCQSEFNRPVVFVIDKS